MLKEKRTLYIFAIVLLLVIVYFNYGKEEARQTVKPKVTTPQEVTLEIEEDETVVVEMPQSPLPLKEEASEEENTAISENIDNEDEEDDVDAGPLVKRSKLIGGADVVWEEPKPKDPNNKFGEPPL